jgi:phosphate/sulfate permease
VSETAVLLALVVVTALAFDFTNGFHDTANAMATSVATGALRPKMAVFLSGTLNLVGAFLSIEVALTVTNAVVKIQNPDGTPKPDLLNNGGFALSTTQVATGSILGSGVGRRGAAVRWAVAGRMVIAWALTIPAAAVVGGVMWWIGDLVGGLPGALLIFVLLVVAATAMYLRSRRAPVDHTNVNDEWQETPSRNRTPVGAGN